MPLPPSMSHSSRASRPVGATTSTRCCLSLDIFKQRRPFTTILGNARQYAPEMMQGRPNANALSAEPELTDGVFMRGHAMFDYRHGALHSAIVFKVTEHD